MRIETILNIKTKVVFCCVVISLFGSAYGDINASGDVFTQPEVIKRSAPKYPKSRARRAHSGIVELGMMVSKEGAVYSPIVRMSTHPDFEQSAVDAVLKYKFKPATLNGVLVDGHYEVRIFYSMEGAKDAVAPEFYNVYRSAKKELLKAQPRQKRLDSKIKKLKSSDHLNYYSLSYLATLEIDYASKFGSDASKLAAFEKIFLFERFVGEENKILNNDLLSWAKESELLLRLRLGQLDRAYCDYTYMQKTQPESVEKFNDSMAWVNEVRTSGKPFKQVLELGSRAYKEVYLVETKFALEATSGELNELTFRCQKGFSEIDYMPDVEYSMPSKWGECWVQVSGSKNATASLVQFK